MLKLIDMRNDNGNGNKQSKKKIAQEKKIAELYDDVSRLEEMKNKGNLGLRGEQRLSDTKKRLNRWKSMK